MSAQVIVFPRRPFRVCEAYLDRTHNAEVILLPIDPPLTEQIIGDRAAIEELAARLSARFDDARRP